MQGKDASERETIRHNTIPGPVSEILGVIAEHNLRLSMTQKYLREC